jgi:cell division protein FtsI (penicillin-binding protein 3)
MQQDYLARFGLMRPAAIELPEVGEPMLPSPWREINTMTVAYGHGMAVSPLQLTSAFAAVVNGGILRPATVIKRSGGSRTAGVRVLSEETSTKMRWLLRLAVVHGTGKQADAPGYAVGGKTGTAEKLIDGNYARDAQIASFVGAFPMSEPRYVIFAMVDEPQGTERTFGYATGGWVAAPVIARVVERMATLYGIEPMQTETPPERGDPLFISATAEGHTVAFE